MSHTLHAPKPPLISPLEPDGQLPDEPLFDRLHLVDVVDWPAYGPDEPWHIDACKLERCQLAGRIVPHLKIWDAILVSVDMSGVRAFDASLLRCELLGCRMSGIQFGEANLSDVVFQNAKLNLASFRSCRLERVVFQNCVLDEADFIGAHLSNVSFINCELRATDFNRVRCKNVDMSRSEVTSIKGVTSLRSVRIKPEQTIQLAPLLCAEVGFVVTD